MLDVIIADDHPVFRAGLKTTIDDVFGAASLRECGDRTGLSKLLRQATPDLLLLDVFFPGLEPEADIRAFRAANKLMVILVVSMLTDRGAVERLLRAGANGFVSKTAPPDSIAHALRDVMAGERPAFLPAPGRGRKSAASDNPVVDLPPRQMDVLRLICMGLSNKEIARELNLSVSTVRAHVSALFHKLGVSNRAAAASCGALSGVLETGETAMMAERS